MAISKERKSSVLKRLLAPNKDTVLQVSKEENIHPSTLYYWLKQVKKQRPPSKVQAEHWSSSVKLSIILATEGMNAYELSEYCRKKGLYCEQINQWKQSCLKGFDVDKTHTKNTALEIKTLKQKNAKLEKELLRKDKALAEAAALLVLQGKLNTLWADEEK